MVIQVYHDVVGAGGLLAAREVPLRLRADMEKSSIRTGNRERAIRPVRSNFSSSTDVLNCLLKKATIRHTSVWQDRAKSQTPSPLPSEKSF